MRDAGHDSIQASLQALDRILPAGPVDVGLEETGSAAPDQIASARRHASCALEGRDLGVVELIDSVASGEKHPASLLTHLAQYRRISILSRELGRVACHYQAQAEFLSLS